MKSFLKNLIKKKLNNYKVQIEVPDPNKALKILGQKKVLVIGSGLAGVSAATVLAERGFEVTLREKNPYFGGKTGAWEVTFPDGFKTQIDHGFHAFFYHYYNLQAFLKKVGSNRFLKPVGDYLILTQELEKLSFQKIEKTPVLNILSLGFNGYYSFLGMMHPRSQEMVELLKYDPDKTFEKYDSQSFREFSDRAKLPKNLELIFNSFSRAFFAEPEQISMAELIKSFHFFYLSHDHGIEYDYFITDYTEAFINPVSEYMTQQGVKIELGLGVDELTYQDEKFSIGGEDFEYVVLAADVIGARKIIENSRQLTERYPDLKTGLGAVKHANGYAVYKIWIKGKIKADWPVFVITDRQHVLDSITQFQRYDAESKKWADENDGSVLELHCYSVQEGFYNEEKVKHQMLAELFHYCPELTDAEIRYEHLTLDHNFTSFGLGLHKSRPTTGTPIPGLKLAGDWVKIPIPAMLMEGAFTSGIFAANEILEQEGLRTESILSVPLKGIFAK